MQRALITGVSGQDGAWLSKLLLEKGYEVYGAARRSASSENWRLRELGILDRVKMIPFELLEYSNIENVLCKVMPDEIYNLAAMSFVGTSFDQPVFTGDVNGLGVVRLLEAARRVCPEVKFYQASTSEMFGSSYSVDEYGNKYQDERTPFHPRSPYGCAKLFAHSMVVNYREAYGIHASSGILFNHESPLRGEEFVTRKITKTLARIYVQKEEMGVEHDVLELGNMMARRDWGHAEDYVYGMWLMLQQESGDDYVLSTGKTRSVQDFVNAAASALGWDPAAKNGEGRLVWEGEGQDMKAYLDGKLLVQVNPKFYRPSDVEYLCGLPNKAHDKLNWKPQISFGGLVHGMMAEDIRREREKMGWQK